MRRSNSSKPAAATNNKRAILAGFDTYTNGLEGGQNGIKKGAIGACNVRFELSWKSLPADWSIRLWNPSSTPAP